MANNPHLEEDGRPYQFSSTRQPANAGRKPSKLKKFIKDNGLSSLDIQLIAKSLIGLPREKLQELSADPKQPILISGFAAALLKDMVRGKSDAMAWLIERFGGKAVQPLEHTGTMAHIQLSPEERKGILDEYFKNHQDQLPGGGDAGVGWPEGAPRGTEETKQEEPGTPEGPDRS